MKGYESFAQLLQQAPLRSFDGKRPLAKWPCFADNVWQAFGENQQAFCKFQSYPFGKMVLKYNPALVNSGGTIITKAHVDSLYYSNALVAEAAGLAPPAQAEKDQLIRSLPSRFGSLTKEQQAYLSRAGGRMWGFATIYNRYINTRAAMIADIRSF
jgi:hypothetical protein